jgi:hypothetical protein
MQTYDLKYISLISGSLRNFKDKGRNCWNFACPFCGDSKKDTRKSRGYLISHQGKLFFKCHNCQLSCTFENFLRKLNPSFYQQYSFEKLSKNDETILRVLPKKEKHTEKKNINLPKLSDLEKNHPANKYYESRKLPESGKSILYFAEDFRKFALETFQNEKYSNMKDNDPRIVMATFDFNGSLKSAQGRTINPDEKQRYVSAKFENAKPPLVFGCERIDLSKTVYVVEGALDSLLLPNCLSMGTSCLSSVTSLFSFVGNDVQTHDKLRNFVLVHDNQPRNKEIIKEYQKSISLGFRVALFPSYIRQKDLNDMILSGHNVLDMIEQNTHSGIKLKILFEQYRKV